MSVSTREYIETCQQFERDHRLWELAGRPSVSTKYSGIVTWALGMSWQEWYVGARDWFLEVYPVFTDGLGGKIVAPEYTKDEIREAQQLMSMGLVCGRLLDDIKPSDGTGRKFQTMFDRMCERQGGRRI